MKPEQRLQSQITAYLRQNDHFINKTQAGPGTDIGTPDIITIDKHGRFLGLEIKRPDGKGTVSVEQKAVGNQIKRNGGRWEVIDSMTKFLEVMTDVEQLF
ncbi:VRR-NUC domain-containing protein [Fructobacillus sp. CRL 2054]|uniref:VRR-NUC domain-containing protein n=1 Tax=Fructobacillus sp. CRL 2054 TaxID=2763007 RepID=UPI00237982E0|nr:VRR-NUC domain-containing protein [Fructobacillus sp. CRL 2054]MDD9139167.1 VRR-NUC domain-containing protein [Fructobacillus sp. CRL 2054]